MNALKTAIVDELRGAISEQSTAATNTGLTLKRILQRAGAKSSADVTSTEAVESSSRKQQDQEDVEKRCVTSLLEKLKAMGSKVQCKSG